MSNFGYIDDPESPFSDEEQGEEGDGFDLAPDEHPANRFLGREFLAWIWYRADQSFGRIELAAFGTVDFWMDDRLVMRGRGEDPQTASFKGGAPSSTQEARASLRAGKAPEEARLGLRAGEKEYVLSVRGEGLDIASLKVPQITKKGETEALLYERMYLFEEATSLLTALYEEFILARIHPSWATSLQPQMQAWARQERREGEEEEE